MHSEIKFRLLSLGGSSLIALCLLLGAQSASAYFACGIGPCLNHNQCYGGPETGNACFCVLTHCTDCSPESGGC